MCAKRPAKKSTAARKDVPGKATVRNDALAQIGTMPPVKAAQPPVSQEAAFASTGDSVRKRVPDPKTAAGTQAPPVDTRRKAEAAAAQLAPKRGRPKIHPDRKLYKAQMERKRRAAKKAGK